MVYGGITFYVAQVFKGASKSERTVEENHSESLRLMTQRFM